MKLNNIPISMLNAYDIINDNYKNIHKQLFDNAIEKYCQEKMINKDDYKIIDKENEDNILKPSTAIIIGDDEIKYIDLSEYWNTNYLNEYESYFDENKIKNLLMNDDNKKYIDIEYIDYINGKIQFKNKFTNKKFYIDFNKLDSSKKHSLNLSNTFTSLYYEY